MLNKCPKLFFHGTKIFTLEINIFSRILCSGVVFHTNSATRNISVGRTKCDRANFRDFDACDAKCIVKHQFCSNGNVNFLTPNSYSAIFLNQIQRNSSIGF